MNEIKNCGAQGDVLFRRIQVIPGEALENTAKDANVVAHSETGHNHVVETPNTQFFSTDDPMVSYMRVKGEYADVVHHRMWDTHGTLRLLKGDWEIRRQREWTPEGLRRVED